MDDHNRSMRVDMETFFSHSHAPKHKADYCKSRTNLQYEMMSSIHTENTDDYDFWFSDRKNARKQKSYKQNFIFQ